MSGYRHHISSRLELAGYGRLMPVVAGLLILVSYHLIFFRYFPNSHGRIGHDYSLFLPRLLDGYIWAKNNSIFSIPWFTPSFCGGEPAYPDPQNIYFTLPQLLTAFFNPLQSVYLTVVLMSIAGYIGSYFTLRSVFRCTTSAATLGATLFLFNGFFIYRMIVGHLAFHAFMLFPWVVYFAFREESQEHTSNNLIGSFAIRAILTALLASYWIFSGMVNLLVPIAVSGLIILLAKLYNRNLAPGFLKILLASMFLFLLIVAGKLSAELYYLKQFNRSFYLLPGTETIFDSLRMVLRSLFFPITSNQPHYFFIDEQWYLGRHEFEYGLTFVPLIVLAFFILNFRNKLKGLISKSIDSRVQIAYAVSIFMLLLLPVALNYHQHEWSEFLKTLPILKNSSTLTRFITIYILPISIVSSVLWDKAIPEGLRKTTFTAVLIVLVIGINAMANRTYYDNQPFIPNGINAAYKKIKETGVVPQIQYIGDIENSSLFVEQAQIGADFTFGISRLKCYEPMFGYRLQKMPIKTLHPGPIVDVIDNRLNLKNPSCYVFPDANQCSPGDQFMDTQKDEVLRFINYKSFPFKFPTRQLILNYVSLVALFGSVIILLIAFAERTNRWLKEEIDRLRK